MRIKFARPRLGDAEAEALVTVVTRPHLSNGASVREFENRFVETIGGGQAVAVSSCTAALHLALLTLGIKHGDEVILPALSFAACAHSIEAVGAVPVFADVHPEAGQMDPEDVERRITPKTRAIMVMHFAGRVGYMGTMLAVARRHNLRIIEDAATALGATHSGRHAGLIGDIGCFSFHPVKHITTGEGGMLVTRSPELAERARSMREFGKWTDPHDLRSFVTYEIRGFGLNFRMTEMSGAVGCVQLQSARERLDRRRANYYKLEHALTDFNILKLGGLESAAYCLIVHAPDEVTQFELRHRLAQRHIETSVYYPGPLPLMPYYRDRYGFKPGDFPHSERIARNTVALSVGPHLGAEEMAYTAKMFKEATQQEA